MTFEEKKKLLEEILDKLELVIRAIIDDDRDGSGNIEKVKENFISFMLEAFEIKE